MLRSWGAYILPSYFHITAVEVEDKGNLTYDHNPSCLCSLFVFYCANSRGKKKKFSTICHQFSSRLSFFRSQMKFWWGTGTYLYAVYVSSWSITILTKKKSFFEQFDK